MSLIMSDRIKKLKEVMIQEERYVSVEQAGIITQTYKKNEGEPTIIKRALSLKKTLINIEIDIHNEELIVGNRTKGVRGGVVFPESGIGWIDKEIDTIDNRDQDAFKVKKKDIEFFRNEILPYWKEISLEASIKEKYGDKIKFIEKVVKINQKDHAQGHICPNCKSWLEKGPKGIIDEVKGKMEYAKGGQLDFYKSVILVMEGVQVFLQRYHDLIKERACNETDIIIKRSMVDVANICNNLSHRPPENFHEAVQSIWFLFVILHMESNASSFSPGRMDQYLYPYYKKDMEEGKINKQHALDIIECLWIKFNQIVYMRNANSAKYFAGFPIGFNIAIGGINNNGEYCENELSYLFLQAQKHLLLPQPNLSVRLSKNIPQEFLEESVRVVSLGSGMPQYFNDESIIPALRELELQENDIKDYAIVGCVEISTQGNNLGWSDAAMFNLNKLLELTINNGRCLITGEQIAPDLGNITDFQSFEQLEKAMETNMKYFISEMVKACELVEKKHMEKLPSPFLSSVIDDCLEKGIDVTGGGAKYNLSGIQIIQVANLADSLGAIKSLVYDKKIITRESLLNALQNNYKGYEIVRAQLLNKSPKYGNDIPWVDELGNKWALKFKTELSKYTNYRGGKYHTGMYTVSAHVPMGQNVGASPDGRYSGEPLADGGLSPVYGRDTAGPTAVLKSVSTIDNRLTSNGGLLNMKFLPEFFKTETGIYKFTQFLRAFIDLEIPHIQFNVLRREDLIAARKNPENYRGLTVRVAGYTAYFTELADELQKEIIARTSYGDI